MVHVLRQSGVELGGVLTTVNEVHQRVAMHAVRVELLQAQADALGLPLRQIPIPSPCPNEVYERAMAAAVERAVSEGFTHVVIGLQSATAYASDAHQGWSLIDPVLYPRPVFARDVALLETFVSRHLEPIHRDPLTLVARLSRHHPQPPLA